MPHNGDTLFEALIATAVDGIAIVDYPGAIQVYNDVCETLFGHAPSEVIGRDIRFLMPKHDGHLVPHRGRAGIGGEVEGCRKDGSAFPIYLSVGEGIADGVKIFVCVIRDLTRFKSEIDGGFAEVRVRDSGPGRPATVQRRLFQPFVTTKENGMGIGLTICQSIVKAHGSSIHMLRDGASGAAFRFRVPFAGQREAA